MPKQVQVEEHTRDELLELAREEGVDLEEEFPEGVGVASKSELAEAIYRRRVANERREKYNEDEEYAESIRETNRDYYERQKEREPDEVEVFDEMLAMYEEKWEREGVPEDEEDVGAAT